MSPVAIFQFSPNVEPGYFASFLEAKGVLSTLIRIDRGESVPDDPTTFSGLCLMGGEMSANDHLPWIEKILQLIRRAVGAEIPVIGHCLGGQLLAKALGAAVIRNPETEIGWGQITVENHAISRHWLGTVEEFPAFHWHNETFSLPEKAISLMASQFCANQAFVVGPHLGMQCHVEMTDELIHTWNQTWAAQTEVGAPSVQASSVQLDKISENLPQMRLVAQHLYERWLENVRRD
jgi:GMP synthase-like glutamine amidotransferase